MSKQVGEPIAIWRIRQINRTQDCRHAVGTITQRYHYYTQATHDLLDLYYMVTQLLPNDINNSVTSLREILVAISVTDPKFIHKIANSTDEFQGKETKKGAEGGTRTHTGVTHTSLSRARLPIPPLRHSCCILRVIYKVLLQMNNQRLRPSQHFTDKLFCASIQAHCRIVKYGLQCMWSMLQTSNFTVALPTDTIPVTILVMVVIIIIQFKMIYLINLITCQIIL